MCLIFHWKSSFFSSVALKEENVTHCSILMFEFTGDNTAYRVNIQRPHHWPRVFIFTISPPLPLGLSQCDHWKNRIKRRNPKAKSKKREKSKTDITSSDLRVFVYMSVYTQSSLCVQRGFYVILWSVRSYWWWWRLVTQEKVSHVSPSRSRPFLWLYFISFLLRRTRFHAIAHILVWSLPGYECCDSSCFMECRIPFACLKWKPH